MTVIEYYHAVAVFQKLHAVDGVHSIGVFGTLQVDGRRKVHRHYAARIVVAVIVGQLGRRPAVSFVEAA